MDEGSSHRPDRVVSRRRIATSRVMAVAWWVGAYLATLDLQGWVFTELATLKAGRLSFAGMLADRATFGHCPLYFTFSWSIQQLFGEDPIALRLPSAVLGLIVAASVVRIATAWADQAAASVAGLLVLVNPFLLEISQQARPYALALAVTLAATATLTDPAAGHPSRRRAIVFGLLTTAGLLTSHAYWFVLVAHAAALLLRPRRSSSLLIGGLAGVVAASPWTIYAKYFATSGGESERFLVWMSPVDAAVSLALPGRLVTHLPFEQGESMAIAIAVSMVAVVLAAVGLARLPRAANGRGTGVRPLLAALWIVPPTAALAAGLAGWGNLLLVPRYFAATAVVQLVLIWWAAWSVGPERRRLAVGLLAVVVAGGSIAYLVEIGHDEVRRCAGIIADRSARDEAIIVIGTHGDVHLFKHYLDRPVVGCFVDPGGVLDRPVSDRHSPSYRGRRAGAWVVIDRAREWRVARSTGGVFEIGRYLEAIGRRYGAVTSERIGELELVHLADPLRPGRGRLGTGADAAPPEPDEG
jgi:mannosyltransferase